ncbi:MAG: hypothetical protein L0Z70_15150 [Chloroflexi bacterium]|nr:hypothetical protein [Chloroflexota bacterium]
MAEAASPPSYAEVERIAAMSDAALRNLHITQCYHELSLALAGRARGGANWCTFAAWASKQAGQTIRKEDLANALQELPGAPEALEQLAAVFQRMGARLGLEQASQILRETLQPEAAIDRSSEAVARGNLKVFAEIGREFARFCAACLEDAEYDAAKIAAFTQALRPGDPPDGQEYLRRAFSRYYQAFFTADEKARVELLLLANLEIGFHEQTRLQPEINAALAAPVIPPGEFAKNLLTALRPHGGWLRGVAWFLLRLFGRLTDFDSAVERYLLGAQRQAQALVTENMMTIQLSSRHKLRLGSDLRAGFPPILQQIANPELRALLAQIDPTPDDAQASGADYWGDLPDRLHFIADMFRCYQTAEELFEPPFNAEQTAALKQGRLPEGRL